MAQIERGPNEWPFSAALVVELTELGHEPERTNAVTAPVVSRAELHHVLKLGEHGGCQLMPVYACHINGQLLPRHGNPGLSSALGEPIPFRAFSSDLIWLPTESQQLCAVVGLVDDLIRVPLATAFLARPRVGY